MRLLIYAAFALASEPAWAGQTYAAYEGRDAVQVGQGGTRVTKNGIDFWTTGAPPRRFQVLGVLTDERNDRPLDGKVIGSKSVAKKVMALSGDAVIVAGSRAAVVGTVGLGQVYGPDGQLTDSKDTDFIQRTTTRLIVIKYLPE